MEFLPIVSLWKSQNRQDFLCSGLQLTNKYILTVRHAFVGMSDEVTVFVRQIAQVDDDVPARIFQPHPERDAAILELVTAAKPIAEPKLLLRSDLDLGGKPVTLRVIDPDNFGVATLSNYSVGNFDHTTGEFVLSPENALAHL